jgi:hypothetical protein
MVVVPTDTHVELKYESTPLDWTAYALTLAGIIGLFFLYKLGAFRFTGRDGARGRSGGGRDRAGAGAGPAGGSGDGDDAGDGDSAGAGDGGHVGVGGGHDEDRVPPPGEEPRPVPAV